jgi:hypothetical protein
VIATSGGPTTFSLDAYDPATGTQLWRAGTQLVWDSVIAQSLAYSTEGSTLTIRRVSDGGAVASVVPQAEGDRRVTVSGGRVFLSGPQASSGNALVYTPT